MISSLQVSLALLAISFSAWILTHHNYEQKARQLLSTRFPEWKNQLQELSRELDANDLNQANEARIRQFVHYWSTIYQPKELFTKAWNNFLYSFLFFLFSIINRLFYETIQLTYPWLFYLIIAEYVTLGIGLTYFLSAMISLRRLMRMDT